MTLFSETLQAADPVISRFLDQEFERQNNHIDLIASENLTSKAVMEAQGSVLTNKYAEGYPGRRYYGGCEFVDEVEKTAIARAQELFKCDFANVQPHSGSQANQAVFLALLKPGDKILGMDLSAGGHLTHGHPLNMSGQWFDVCTYGVSKNTCLIDYDQVADIARREKPKLIIAGFSAYSRPLNYKKFREIADEVGAFLLADMAHIAGLVATGMHQSPLPYADVVTSTTHKTLRGPRGGIILSNNKDLFKKINSSLFPGIQGGPLMHVIAGKAVAFGLALKDDFKEYMRNVVANAQTLAGTLLERGFNLVTGGTENHLLMIDLRNKDVSGAEAEQVLEKLGIIVNKNTIPFDPQPPMVTSGLRLGTPSVTTRGMGAQELTKIGRLIADVIENLSVKRQLSEPELLGFEKSVTAIAQSFPFYSTHS